VSDGFGQPVDANSGNRRVVLRGGSPAWLTAALLPIAALGLVANRLSGNGMEQGIGEPVAPWLIAIFTVVGGLVLAWRAATQRTELAADVLVCRNLLVSFEVPWTHIEQLVVRRRLGLVVVDVRVHRLRRMHRIGAATRFAGQESEAVLNILARHESAGALLSSDAVIGLSDD